MKVQIRDVRVLCATAVVLLGATVVACSGDGTSPGSPLNKGMPQDSSMPDALPDVAAGDASSTSFDATEVTDADASSDADASDSDASLPVLNPPGCFAGTPQTNAEIINACTNAQFVVIDNCARIGLCDGGTLPALVPPPDSGFDAAPVGAAKPDTGIDAAPVDAASVDGALSDGDAETSDASTEAEGDAGPG